MAMKIMVVSVLPTLANGLANGPKDVGKGISNQGAWRSARLDFSVTTSLDNRNQAVDKSLSLYENSRTKESLS